MSRFLSVGLLASLLAGCATTETSFRPRMPAPPGPGAPCQVHAAWENRIMVTEDVVNNGQRLVGLAGRVYLFGEELGHPMPGDGNAMVELCNLDKLDSKGNPELMEQWVIHKDDFRRLLKKDMIGWGYTLFLPWRSYRPDITKVQLQVRYLPDKGLPLYSPPAVVSLRGETQLTVSQRQMPSLAPSPPSTTAAAPPATVAAPPTASLVVPAGANVPAAVRQ